VVLILTFVALVLAILFPSKWLRHLTVYFSLSAFMELYISFLLNYHAAETLLLGTYGVVPPYSGTSNLPAVIVGLDLNTYVQPLVTAGFSLPFYLGFLCLGLIIASAAPGVRRRKPKKVSRRGVEAVFTPELE
jgi:hypothetical protein